MTSEVPGPLIGASAFIQAAGISYRQLHTWTDKGILPAITTGTGQGFPRRYHAGLIPLARLIGDLTAAGIDLSLAVLLARRLGPTGIAELQLRSGASIRLTLRRR